MIQINTIYNTMVLNYAHRQLQMYLINVVGICGIYVVRYG